MSLVGWADISRAEEETEGLRNTRARTARWSAARAGWVQMEPR